MSSHYKPRKTQDQREQLAAALVAVQTDYLVMLVTIARRKYAGWGYTNGLENSRVTCWNPEEK